MSITAPGTVIPCTTDADFRRVISDHPGGLSVVHFWADWAPACKHMNEVLEELAKQYPYVTFVTVCFEYVDVKPDRKDKMDERLNKK